MRSQRLPADAGNRLSGSRGTRRGDPEVCNGKNADHSLPTVRVEALGDDAAHQHAETLLLT